MMPHIIVNNRVADDGTATYLNSDSTALSIPCLDTKSPLPGRVIHAPVQDSGVTFGRLDPSGDSSLSSPLNALVAVDDDIIIGTIKLESHARLPLCK